MEEDKQLEAEALAQIDEQKIRDEVISEFGFDEVDNADLIDKAVAREVKTRTIAAKAIGSKIKAREELDNLRKDPRLQNQPSAKKEDNVLPDDWEKKLDEKVSERLEKRELDSLEYPDELKSEISSFAKFKGISVKQALRDPYILSRTESYDDDKAREDRVEKATIGQTRKSRTKDSFSYELGEEAPNVDWNDPKSVEKYENWKKEVAKRNPLGE